MSSKLEFGVLGAPIICASVLYLGHGIHDDRQFGNLDIEATGLLNALVIVLQNLYANRAPIIAGTTIKALRPNVDPGLAIGTLLAPFVLFGLCTSIQDHHLFQYFQVLLNLSLMLVPVKLLLTRGSSNLRWTLSDVIQGISFLICFYVTYSNLASLSLAVILSVSAVVLYSVVLPGTVSLFQKSFSMCEAMIISDISILLFMDVLVATYYQFDITTGPGFMHRQRHPTHILMHGLVFGMIFVGILTRPLLSGIKARHESKQDRIQLSLLFVACAAGIVVFLLRPWMDLLLGVDPFIWLGQFVMEKPITRLGLMGYWAGLIGAAVVVANLFLSKASSFVPMILNSKRKYFHGLAVLMFIPGYLIDPELMHLAFSVALSALIFIEYIRFFRVWPYGEDIHLFLQQFIDKRDSGPIILSHIYLLVGCAVPVWLNRIPNRVPLAGLSGVIALGVADSMASLIGYRYGQTKWPGSSKSVEGTAAFVFSFYIVAVSLFPSWNTVIMSIPVAVLSGLLEAFSAQNDNLVIPLYSLALFNLL